jgi:hypothetical protein
MAYLHCHNCGWSQDDFWEYRFDKKAWKEFFTFKWQKRPFGYNPHSILLEDIAEYIKPRFIIMDSHWAKENSLKSNRVHSWWFIKEGFKRFKRVRKNMLYKTQEHLSIDWDLNSLDPCPKCGNIDKKYFDID